MFDQNQRRLLIKMIYNLCLLLMVGWCILSISPCQPLHAVGYPFDCPNIVCLIAFPNIIQTPKQNYPSQLEKTSGYRKETEPEIFPNTNPYTNLAYNVMSAYCWVRVASSTWNVLWLWNTNKERLKSKFRKQLGSSPTTSLNSEGKEETLECLKSWTKPKKNEDGHWICKTWFTRTLFCKAPAECRWMSAFFSQWTV